MKQLSISPRLGRTIERFGEAMADGKALELSERFHSVVQCARQVGAA
jgi:hypothetical protein